MKPGAGTDQARPARGARPVGADSAGEADEAVEALVALFGLPAARSRYNEAVTQIEHALQCAALAEASGAGDALVAAALLHDVGHLLAEDAPRVGERPAEDHRHETAGSLFLVRWFGPEVTRPVALHVVAKRYLCTADPSYLATLSPASVHSLELQGGPMTSAQCDAFRAVSGFHEAVMLRRWDDRAKVPDGPTPSLEHFRPLLRRLVRA